VNKLVLACALGVGAGLAAWSAGGDPDAPLTLSAEATYADQDLDGKIREAGGIVVGRVVGISPTRWNQDDGTFWETVSVDARGRATSDTALPYYEVTIAAERVLLDAVGMAPPGEPVVATVIGMSPAGGADASTSLGEAVVAGEAEGPMAGQPIVAFLRPTDMAWRDGTRPILQLMGDPGHQMALGTSPDGHGETLDEADLAARIAALRGSAIG
jgi:hypothetical protein